MKILGPANMEDANMKQWVSQKETELKTDAHFQTPMNAKLTINESSSVHLLRSTQADARRENENQ